MTQVPWYKIIPSAGRPFIKMQGLHNHFVIVDGRDNPYKPTVAEASQICDVKRGVGADQLLVIEEPTAAGAAVGAHAFMRIINIDGRDAQACGNATRCVGWLLLEEAGLDEVIIETLAGALRCQRKGEKQVAVAMGRISTDWKTIPLAREIDTLHVPVGNGPLQEGIALNIGNPHIVYFVDNLDALDLAALAEPIQKDPLFPEQANVNIAQVIGDAHLRLSVYERPGVLTAACGSGACVTSRAAQLRGLTDKSKFTVEMFAGSVEIEIREGDSAMMTGPVEFCFSGTLTGE